MAERATARVVGEVDLGWGTALAALLLAAALGCGDDGSSRADDGGGEAADADVEGEVDGGGDGDADGDAVDDAADADGDEADADGDGGDVVPPGCGNGVLEDGEECDGTVPAGTTCETLGLTPGVLACGADCRFDVAGCATCGDGRCERGETPTSCAAECNVVDLAAGAEHACAVLADGSVRCWGAREGHRMGGVGDTRRPVPVAGIVGATKVAAGAGHSSICAGDGRIWCWGRNGFGELGLGTIRAEVYPPEPAVGVTGMRDVLAGAYHTCSIAGFGSLTCWGRGDHGTMGDGTWVARQPTPTAIDLGMMVTVTSAAAGMHHTCVLEFSRVECWGDNAVGQLGVANQVWQAEPARALPDWATAVGVGYFHSCAAVADFMNPTRDGLYCWGNNSYGQLGVPASPDILGPQRVGGMTARLIAGGYGHTCVLVEDSGAPQCWGANNYGQLGDGTLESRHTPAAVTGLTNAIDVVLGRDFSCALLADHTVRCWGSNDRGQLGDGTTVRRSATPVEPVGL